MWTMGFYRIYWLKKRHLDDERRHLDDINQKEVYYHSLNWDNSISEISILNKSFEEETKLNEKKRNWRIKRRNCKWILCVGRNIWNFWMGIFMAYQPFQNILSFSDVTIGAKNKQTLEIPVYLENSTKKYKYLKSTHIHLFPPRKQSQTPSFTHNIRRENKNDDW